MFFLRRHNYCRLRRGGWFRRLHRMGAYLAQLVRTEHGAMAPLWADRKQPARCGRQPGSCSSAQALAPGFGRSLDGHPLKGGRTVAQRPRRGHIWRVCIMSETNRGVSGIVRAMQPCTRSRPNGRLDRRSGAINQECARVLVCAPGDRMASRCRPENPVSRRPRPFDTRPDTPLGTLAALWAWLLQVLPQACCLLAKRRVCLVRLNGEHKMHSDLIYLSPSRPYPLASHIGLTVWSIMIGAADACGR